MKRKHILAHSLAIALALSLGSCGAPEPPAPAVEGTAQPALVDPAPLPEPPEPEQESQEVWMDITQLLPALVCSGGMDVYTISDETYVRSGERVGDASELGQDEYHSYTLHLLCPPDRGLSWQEAYVTVDGGEPWYWAAGSLPAGSSTDFHIYYENMQKLALGSHSVIWYMDGQVLYEDTFMLTRDLDWDALTDLPSAEEIATCNAAATLRSPYMAFWLDIPDNTCYTEYSVDFKTDHLPLGSYYSLGNWYMDYSGMTGYVNVTTEYGINGYAGCQNIYNGDKIAIMSMWDVFATDAAGSVTTIRAEKTYPADAYHSGEFTGEGTGAQCMAHYPWEENHWYRITLRCVDGATTTVEFWVTDLETGAETKISTFDTGLVGSSFRGKMCIFLENYLTEYAGNVRTMEICNARYLDKATGQWCAVHAGEMIVYGDAMGMNYAGSYDYGVADGRLWIMTTGVGNNCDNSAGTYLDWGN